MKTNKYKILVLSDTKNPINNSFKSAVGLAKMIDGEITILNVKKPSEVIKEDNQFSAMREINNQYKSSKNKIKNAVRYASEKYGINATYTFTIGQVKHEIDAFLFNYKPDIIVIGKRKPNILRFTGDRLCQHIISTFTGPILVTDNKKTIQSNEPLNIGIYNGLNDNMETNFFDNLITHTQKPIKLFKILDSNTIGFNRETAIDNSIEFIFEKNDDSMANLSNYLEKSNVNLLYLNRQTNGTSNSKTLKRDISKLIGSLKVPMLLSPKLSA